MKRDFLELLRKPVLKKIAKRLGLQVKGMNQAELVDLLDSFDDALIKKRYDMLIKSQDAVRAKINTAVFDIPLLLLSIIKVTP